jgi:hypothetical protein
MTTVSPSAWVGPQPRPRYHNPAPSRLKCYPTIGHDHFITFSCYDRLPLLNNDRRVAHISLLHRTGWAGGPLTFCPDHNTTGAPFMTTASPSAWVGFHHRPRYHNSCAQPS